MQPRLPIDAVQLVEKKNAEAVRLLAKGRLHDALDALNEAIRIAPSYPDSFSNRARVFARLGMAAQAEADQRRAQELAHTAGDEVAEPAGEAAPVAQVADTRSGEVGDSWRRLLDTVWHARQGKALQTVTGLVVLAGIAAGILFGLRAWNGEDSEPGVASASSTPVNAPATVPEVLNRDERPNVLVATVPAPTPGTAGSPFSFADLQRAWEAGGIAVTPGERSAGFSALGATAFDVRLTRGSDAMDLSMLVYRDREAAKKDWELTPGEAPVLKDGRNLPDNISIWWNRNVIVVVRSRLGDIGTDALDAFFALNP